MGHWTNRHSAFMCTFSMILAIGLILDLVKYARLS